MRSVKGSHVGECCSSEVSCLAVQSARGPEAKAEMVRVQAHGILGST